MAARDFQLNKQLNLMMHEKLGLILFGWLFLVSCMNIDLWPDPLISVFEYRFFLLLPLIGYLLSSRLGLLRDVFKVSYLGGVFALTMSYLLVFGVVEVNGAQYSLANRVFHSFVMTMLILASIFLWFEVTNWKRYLFLTIAIAAAINLMFVENGRGGYLMVLVSFLLVVSFNTRMKTIIFLFGTFTIALAVGYGMSEKFSGQLLRSLQDLSNAIDGADYTSSIGQRLEYLRAGTTLLSENPVFGIVGQTVTTALANAHDTGMLRYPTDNLHNQYLMIGLVGGVAAIIFYCLFWLSWVQAVWRLNSDLSLKFLAFSVCAVCLVSGAYNSIINDFGEKHVLILVMSMLAAEARLRKSSASSMSRNSL